MATIAVIDYGMGNLRSVAKALEHVTSKARVIITQSKAAIEQADRIVFPGQGAIRDCMQELHRLELVQPLLHAAQTKPFLGLCLGPQALLTESEENGGVPGLAIIAGRCRWFGHHLAEVTDPQHYKIPHMGWNQVTQCQPHPLWQGIAQDSRFYFVHSYYLALENPTHIAAKTHYIIDFPSVITKDNVFAVQFHPEKSAQDGLRLLQNFCAWQPS